MPIHLTSSGQKEFPSYKNYRSGEYYDSRTEGSFYYNYNTYAITIDTIYFVRFRVFDNKSVTFDRIGYEKTSGTGTGRATRLGIYTGANNRPYQLIAQSEITGADSNGGFEATINVTLPAGTYWLAILVNISTTVRSLNDAYSQGIGFSSLTELTTNNALSAPFTYGALPSNTSALTMSYFSNNTPRILMRAS